MVKSWAAIGCTKRQGGRVIFHIFPVGKFRQKQWLASLKLVNPPVLKLLQVCSSMFRPLPWCILCKKSQTTVRITYKRGTWGTANHKVIWKFMNIAQHLQINCIPVRLWRKGWIKTILVYTSIIQIFGIWFYLKLAVLQKLFSFM